MIKRFKVPLLFLGFLLSLGSLRASENGDRPCGTTDTLTPFQNLLESKERRLETGVELLVFTSTISSIFSDAQVLLDEAFGTDNAAQIFRNKVESIDPDYDAGLSFYFKYHPSRLMNTVGLSYSYIHSDGDGHLHQENSTFIPLTNMTQITEQHDKGSQHTHLHIANLTIEKSLPITPYFLINLQTGMAFHSFHYSFNLQNQLDVTQVTGFGGAVVGIQNVDISANEKGNFYGVGPNIGVQFDFALFSPNSCHDLNFVGMTNFGFICARDALKGSLSYNKRLLINGQDTGSSSSQITWKNPSVTHFIPNINLDFKLQYRWHHIHSSSVSFILSLGYRFISYWNVDQTGRRVCALNGDETPSLQDYTIYPRDLEDFGYCGPYLRIGVGF